jgi:hypothetical protein
MLDDRVLLWVAVATAVVAASAAIVWFLIGD